MFNNVIEEPWLLLYFLNVQGNQQNYEYLLLVFVI